MSKRAMPLLVFLLSLSVATGSALAAQSPQIPLSPKAIPMFAQPLPLLSVQPGGTMATVVGNQPLAIHMCEFDARVLPAPLPSTRVWGYIAETPGTVWAGCPTTPQDTYIGPVIVNNRGSSTDVTWINDLGSTASTGVLAYKYSTDQTMHWADPLGAESNVCNHDAMMGLAPAFGSDCAQNYAGPIPAVVHLHGGEVPPELDGGPDAWFTSDGAYQGHGYYSFAGAPANAATYKYPNTQEASPIWFHDHTLGATRLNVYAGLAGAYFIQDPGLNLPANLQPLAEVVPVVLQDRMFDTNGQLFFQADSAGGLLWATNPQHPYWSPEFVGDTIVVNGKAWPYLNVDPKRYRFLFLNGSNARTYELSVVDPLKVAVEPNFWVIGTDGGYLDAPVLMKKLVIMPGERYEVIIDFAGTPAGTNLVLKNTAKTPFPGGAVPPGGTVGQVMQFRVGTGPVADASYNPAAPGATLRAAGQKIVRLVNPATGTLATGVTVSTTRQLTLNEVMGMPVTTIDPVTGLTTAYPGGPLEILVNNTKWSGESTGHPEFTQISVTGGKPLHTVTTNYSEIPQEGTTEVWEIVNITADAHPIHLHLVQFQLLNRQDIDAANYSLAYAAAFPGGGLDPMTGLPYPPGVFIPGFGPPLDYYTGNARALGGNPDIAALSPKKKPLYLKGTPQPPAANEAGWKDTVVMYPGQVTRIVVRWAPTDLSTATAASGLYFPFDPYDGAQHGYVWHCHIIDHEDNEMMRPDLVTLNPLAPPPASRPLVKGINY